ncbi:glycosyl hydrolase [Pedobacter sp. MC2016-05]|uniref:glycosyl hydrolase n=1 Tax=Pedobacter sp. MC2016-05 TaxID=2994474 RepID=UPI002246C1FD|nr:glycosyl hydrolase [Pedobacter sp. MC2016-05]MCX2474925.1 glycosyl hydrolase [Pedobacter sp. MC2016-05]
MRKQIINGLMFLAILIFTSCKGGEDINPEPSIDGVKPPVGVSISPFKTINYLNEISGNKTVAGMHNREPNSDPTRWTEEVKTVTDKYPALWSGDFLFQADNINNRQIMIDQAVNQWKKGAIINIMWHACNPANSQPCGWDDGKGVMSSLSDEQFTQLITDGTAINTKWKQMMDEVCIYLQQLEDKGVEVLWRPLHEMNQGKFWWGGRPGANGTRKLYQLTHDYMTKTKGLSNLIWVWNIQDFGSLSSDVNTYNPGDNYFDVVSMDMYFSDGSGYTAAKYKTILDIAKGKPIAIGECEKYPTPQQLLEQPKWTFFMGWSELVFKEQSNTQAQIKALHNAVNVVTLDEMPGWNR